MGYGFTQLNQETKTKVFNFVSIYIMNYLNSEEKRMLSEPSGDEHKKEEIYKYAIIRYFNAKNIITNDK